MTRDEIVKLKNIQISSSLIIDELIDDSIDYRYKYGINVIRHTSQYHPFCIISNCIWKDTNLLYDYRKMSEHLLQKEYLTEVSTRFYAPIKSALVKYHYISTLSFDTIQHIINDNIVLFQKVNEKYKQDSLIVQLG